jgi:tape measure domain-containing protein
MATISSTLALNDSMTPVLRSIASALESVNATLDRLNAALDRSFDPSTIQAATRAVQQTEAAQETLTDSVRETERVQDTLTDSVRATERAQDEVTQSMNESQRAADGLWGKIKGFIAAYAGWELVKQTVAWSDEMTGLQARLDLINDGTRTNRELMNEVYFAAQRSHASLQSTATIVARIGNNAREAFSSNDELIAFAEQLQKQFTISGAGAQEAEYALIQLSQGLAAGALRGEELNSVFEQAPAVIRTIAEYMKVPVGQIRALAAEGKITADIVKNAMFTAAEKTNKQFNEMPLTFGAAWTMAKNTFQMQMLGVQKIISETINSKMFQQILDTVSNSLSTLAAFAVPLIKGIAAAVGFLYNNWDLIAPVIYTVVGAMAAYKTVALASVAVDAIVTGAKIAGVVAQYAWAAATGVAASATAAETAAVLGLNTALLASPVTWIIAAIAAVIGLLYLSIAVINRVTGANYSATGIIAATIYGLWAYIKNIIATVWNTLLSLAEFFYNVWTNPVYSLKKLLYSLLETFSGLYVGILQGLDPVITGLTKGFLSWVNTAIKGINWLSSALEHIGLGWGQVGEITMQGTVASNAEAARNSMLSALNPGAAPEGYKSLDHLKMDFADPQAYADAGYAAGEKFGSDPMGSIKSALGLANDPAIQSIMDGQDKGNKLAAQTAKNTTPKAEEDYKYLKEIMAGRAVDRLSGTDIRIQMNNNNSINSALDLDSIVSALAQKLTGAMDSAAEGVHA